MVLAGGAVVAAAVLWGRAGALHGVTTLLLFALLAVLTALSVLWSIVPELTYVEAGRTLAYLAVFAAAVAGARLAPRAAPAGARGAPGRRARPGARTRSPRASGPARWPRTSCRTGSAQPFDYWNAVGSVAAMAVPVALWLGSRRAGSPHRPRAGLPGAWACASWRSCSPSRAARSWPPRSARSRGSRSCRCACAASRCCWCRSSRGGGGRRLGALEGPLLEEPAAAVGEGGVAGEFGAARAAAWCVLLLLAGAAVETGRRAAAPSARLRSADRHSGRGRRPASCRWRSSPPWPSASAGIGDRDRRAHERDAGGSARRAAGASSPPPRRAASTGARRAACSTTGRSRAPAPGTSQTARLRHRNDAGVTRHAHGFVAADAWPTSASLGSWSRRCCCWPGCSRRCAPPALLPRRLVRADADDAPAPRRDWDARPHRAGRARAGAVVFGLQSMIDWTWFIPGPR